MRECERCGDLPTTRCCDSHGKTLCHWCYRVTHFVEVCDCPICEGERDTAILMRRDEKEDAS